LHPPHPFFYPAFASPPAPPSFPTRRSSDLLHRERFVRFDQIEIRDPRSCLLHEILHRHDRREEQVLGLAAAGRIAGDFRDRLDADRKSTRLNSSHVSISYAVFCLKKKMKST